MMMIGSSASLTLLVNPANTHIDEEVNDVEAQSNMTVKFSCVVDQRAKFARQAFVWASSLLKYAEQEPDSILIHFVYRLNPKYKRIFDSWGIKTQIVKPFDSRHPHSNKLTQLESESLHSVDYVVLCDCDIAFCESISDWITGDSVRASIVHYASLPLEQWQRIFRMAKLDIPSARVRAMIDDAETLPTYCNSGIIIVPQPIFQNLRKIWPKWDRWLLNRPELVKPFVFFTDQISFTLSCEELGLNINYLPIELNFAPNAHFLDRIQIASRKKEIHPIVLHYHGQGDFLRPLNIDSVDRQLQKINDLIRLRRRLVEAH